MQLELLACVFVGVVINDDVSSDLPLVPWALVVCTSLSGVAGGALGIFRPNVVALFGARREAQCLLYAARGPRVGGRTVRSPGIDERHHNPKQDVGGHGVAQQLAEANGLFPVVLVDAGRQ